MAKATSSKGRAVHKTSITPEVPGFQLECCHPGCESSPQRRYEFPVPLCSRHIVKVMARSIELAKDAKRAHVVQNAASMPGARRAEAHDPVVYYVKFGDRVKIGTTTNFQARMSNIPHDEVLAVEPGGRELEQLRHKQFAEARSHREWFDLSAELFRHIDRIKANKIPS